MPWSTTSGGSAAYLVTDDPDGVFDSAVAAGASVVRPMQDQDYGGRGGSVADPEGNHWSFGSYQPRITCLPVAVRAVRGATQLERDDRDHMLERVAEMVTDAMSANDLSVDDFISVIFTATSDLVAEFPAYAARRLGFGEVPLLCARELEIEGSMPRVVRMLAHVETDLPRAEVTHVYLHGAAALRTDLTRVRSSPDA